MKSNRAPGEAPFFKVQFEVFIFNLSECRWCTRNYYFSYHRKISKKIKINANNVFCCYEDKFDVYSSSNGCHCSCRWCSYQLQRKSTISIYGYNEICLKRFQSEQCVKKDKTKKTKKSHNEKPKIGSHTTQVSYVDIKLLICSTKLSL